MQVDCKLFFQLVGIADRRAQVLLDVESPVLADSKMGVTLSAEGALTPAFWRREALYIVFRGDGWMTSGASCLDFACSIF